MVVLKRKQAIITIIICMILAAGYINWAYQSSPSVPASTDVAEEKNLGEATMVNASVTQGAQKSVIDTAKESRDSARDKSREILNSTISNPSIDAESKAAASAEITAMASAMEKEGICEGVLETKVGKAVVFISNGNVSVTLEKSDALKDTDVAKIKDIVMTHTGISADKIKISGVSE